MLNMNSPTVQAMINNLPQGIGNMPVYFGNTPSITEVQNSQQNNMPYPSPKEMILQSGESMVYSPTSFTPRNIVGGYNPGFQTAFSNYYNPYMGYGSYNGFNGMMMQVPMDEDARLRQELANINGITYDEQLIMESNMFKELSRIVSKNLGRSDEETEKCEHIYDIYNKYPAREQFHRKQVKPMHIQIKVGDNVVADMSSGTNINLNNNYIQSSMYVDQMIIRNEMIKNEISKRNNYIYSTACERRLDDMDLLDFFNKGAHSLMMDSIAMLLNMQNITRTSQVYDSDKFRSLLVNNGIKKKSAIKAIDRFVGRYGVMPDGRPVSPGHDPAVATSFSYNPATGQYSVTAPNFIKDRLDRARESFIRSIDDN